MEGPSQGEFLVTPLALRLGLIHLQVRRTYDMLILLNKGTSHTCVYSHDYSQLLWPPMALP